MIKIINKIISNPKKVFLLDGIGAFLSAFLLGFIIARYHDIFGIPQTILYFLSAVAFIYMVYSLCCYYFVFGKWQAYLRVVIIANILYCCLTTAVVFYFRHLLTVLGLIYFINEIIILILLISIEIKTIKKISLPNY